MSNDVVAWRFAGSHHGASDMIITATATQRASMHHTGVTRGQAPKGPSNVLPLHRCRHTRRERRHGRGCVLQIMVGVPEGDVRLASPGGVHAFDVQQETVSSATLRGGARHVMRMKLETGSHGARDGACPCCWCHCARYGCGKLGQATTLSVLLVSQDRVKKGSPNLIPILCSFFAHISSLTTSLRSIDSESLRSLRQ